MNKTNSFFHHPEAILVEIAFGATMARATTLEINLRGAFLDIHDDRPFKTDDDAWFHSFLLLMAASETITFTDRLGTVTVDCVRYFSDEEYRARVFKEVKAPKAAEGFHLLASLAGTQEDIAIDALKRLCLFPLDIFWNGGRVKRTSVEDLCKGHTIVNDYMGNRVYIRPTRECSQKVPDANLEGVSVIWHCLPIYMPGLEPWDIVIDVERNDPLTPTLGWTQIHPDEKAEAFALFIREMLVAYYCGKVEELIRKGDESDRAVHELVCHMRMAAEVCTREDLDRLEVFYYERVDRHFPFDVDGGCLITYRLVRPTETLVNETLHLLVDGKTVWEGDDEFASGPILPESTLQGVELPEKRPTWLRVEDKVIEVRVTSKDLSLKQFAWHRADIESDREIEVIAVFSENQGVDVYYRDSPDAFRAIEEGVFRAYCYSPDSDTYDTQRDAYQKAIDEQIARVSGIYNPADLLEGLRIAGIDPYDVKAINTEADVMKVTTTNGEVILRIAA